MVEFTAVGAWVLDPAISRNDRIARVFSTRHKSLDDQIGFVNAVVKDPAQLQEVVNQMSQVEGEAVNLGFTPMRSEKNPNKITAIGIRMPNATNMVDSVFGVGWLYRLLSGIAHGQSWAITELGYRDATDKVGHIEIEGHAMKAYEKTAPLGFLKLIGLHGCIAVSRLVWNTANCYGSDLLLIEETLERSADRLKMSKEIRFWRSNP